MQVKDIQDLLTPFGLQAPDLEMLRPTQARYQCLLLQPKGQIFADEQNIKNYDEAVASSKGVQFLRLAIQRQAHLVVTPEYFLPWQALVDAIQGGICPGNDSLWILGCQSIRPSELSEFIDKVSHKCLVLHEPCDGMRADRTLLDPVVLLFNATGNDGDSRLVAVVQFKTYPSRDRVFYEDGVLKIGSFIYRFLGRTGHLSVASVICSDVFALAADNNVLAKLIDRATLVHVQLNPNPRNDHYRQYRARAFLADPKVSDCHIVCLNWAHSVVVKKSDGTVSEDWKNIGGSAWYCPADGCSSDDDIVLQNHNGGLYYTRMEERRNALFFDYEEAVFELQVPKLLTCDLAVMANRNGPSATHRYIWTVDEQNWTESTIPANTGFEGLLAKHPEAEVALGVVHQATDVLGVERVAALTAGAAKPVERWFATHEIDSCQVKKDEVVLRLTVAQDQSESAREFRNSRLVAVSNVQKEIQVAKKWPPQVDGIDPTSVVHWDKASPNFNIVSSNGKPSLVLYMGESPDEQVLKRVADNMFELLRRAGGPWRDRLCIMYRKFGELRFAEISALTRYDDAIKDKTDFTAIESLGNEGGLS